MAKAPCKCLETIKMKAAGKRILVVAAHPDDEVLGCGGTLVKMIRELGCKAWVLLLTNYNVHIENKIMQRQIEGASTSLGVQYIIEGRYEDQKFDMYPLCEIADTITGVINRIMPDVVYTHSDKDMNQDHVIVSKATSIATRPLTSAVREVYAYEVLSSTHYGTNRFSPDFFVDITKTISTKQMAMGSYKTELKEFPHPRSLAGIETLSRFRGTQSGCHHAEAFETIRRVM